MLCLEGMLGMMEKPVVVEAQQPTPPVKLAELLLPLPDRETLLLRMVLRLMPMLVLGLQTHEPLVLPLNG
jgi:hypothetical protein